jgi:mannose-6-phosphate isomerase-like protein (cupin superfamily)
VSNWRYLCPIIFAALFSVSQVHSQSVKEPNKGNNEFLVTIDKMPLLEALPGELLHIVEGKSNGFESLSILISETKPGSGAPPHMHKCEEAYVLLDGIVEYKVAETSFVAKAPCAVRIPANTLHSFKNIGPKTISVIGIFPKNTEAEIDPNAK